MITVDLNDNHLREHLQAILELRKSGFMDDELQKMYDKQLVIDRNREVQNDEKDG